MYDSGTEPRTFTEALANLLGLGRRASPGSCINNLRQLDGATQQWAIENKKSPEAQVTMNDLLPYMKAQPRCPRGGFYLLSRVKDAPKCNVPGHQLPNPADHD